MALPGADLPELLQKAVMRALASSEDVITAFAGETPRVYERVPTKHQLPYIHAGQLQIVDDTHCVAAWECFVTTHVWSDKPGKYEAQRVGGAVAVALNTELEIAGYVCTDFQFRDQTYFTDADGLSTHGVITHRFLIDQAN